MFYFIGDPNKYIPKKINQNKIDFLINEFMLPFQCITIEDQNGLIIIRDQIRNSRGIKNIRNFIYVSEYNTIVEHKQKRILIDKPIIDSPLTIHQLNHQINSKKVKIESIKHNRISIVFGTCYNMEVEFPRTFTPYITIDKIMVGFLKKHLRVYINHIYKGKNLKEQIGKIRYDLIVNNTLEGLTSAIEEILYTNNSERFIFEISNVKKKNTNKKPNTNISRENSRPKYLLLKPFEIRRIMGVKDPVTILNEKRKRKSPKPHERRAHTRTLRSKFFKNKRGTKISIPAKWIGTDEKIIDNKRYKVILDENMI